MSRLPEDRDARRSPADTASCSALAARLRHEAAALSPLLEQLEQLEQLEGGHTDPAVRRELADVIEDLELLASSLQRHVGAQRHARGLTVERALSEQGRGRQALLRASHRVRRPPGKYRGLP